jgi:hypothetical protein
MGVCRRTSSLHVVFLSELAIGWKEAGGLDETWGYVGGPAFTWCS